MSWTSYRFKDWRAINSSHNHTIRKSTPQSSRFETLQYFTTSHPPWWINDVWTWFKIEVTIDWSSNTLSLVSLDVERLNKCMCEAILRLRYELTEDTWGRFGICFKQHFDTRYLVFYNPSPPRMFLSLDLLSEYGIQHGAIGPLYVTSSYSIWIFCRGVSCFATDCPCDVWCRGLTTCLLHVGPPFGNRFLNTSWAVGLTYRIVYLHFFCILTSAITYVLIHHIIFWLYLYFLNFLYFFKYSCTNFFHRRSLCTVYMD